MFGRRDNYITAHNTVTSGRGVVNRDGFLVEAAESTIEFWGKIDSMRTKEGELPQNTTFDGIGKRYNNRRYKINCDSRDIEDLTIDHYLTIDGGTDKYQVIDIYDGDISGIDFDATVIAQLIR